MAFYRLHDENGTNDTTTSFDRADPRSAGQASSLLGCALESGSLRDSLDRISGGPRARRARTRLGAVGVVAIRPHRVVDLRGVGGAPADALLAGAACPGPGVGGPVRRPARRASGSAVSRRGFDIRSPATGGGCGSCLSSARLRTVRPSIHARDASTERPRQYPTDGRAVARRS